MSENDWINVVGCMRRVMLGAKKEANQELYESTLYSFLLYQEAKHWILAGREPQDFEDNAFFN